MSTIRVDVAGVPIYVRSEFECQHLTEINEKMARMKLALHKLKWIDGDVGETARIGLGK